MLVLLLFLHCVIFMLVLLLCCVARWSFYCNTIRFVYSVLVLFVHLHRFLFILVLLLCCVYRSTLYCNIPSDLRTLYLSCMLVIISSSYMIIYEIGIIVFNAQHIINIPPISLSVNDQIFEFVRFGQKSTSNILNRLSTDLKQTTSKTPDLCPIMISDVDI